MLFTSGRFRDAALEEQYQAEKRDRLAQADMRSAVLFALMWLHDVVRFLRLSPGALLKATVWLVAVGMKPVYVYVLVGKDFYVQYRSWIIAFTKSVFAMHPPGENLHLLAMQRTVGANTSPAGVLWAMANGMRLPYMLVTGLGWQDFLYNMPVQLALVGRAIKDNEAQCATPFFSSPLAQAVLHGIADRLTSAVATCLYMGTGINTQQATFPSSLDPCSVLGTWGVLCFGFLLTTLVLATTERRARAEFASRHAGRLTDTERAAWEDSGSSWTSWLAAALLLGYACMLAWQALLSVFAWSSRLPLASMSATPHANYSG